MFRERVELKTPAQIEIMRQAGLVVAETLQAVKSQAGAGMTTGDLDRIARESIAAHGATSNFWNYGADDEGHGGFPGVICTSVNDEIVHGIPGPRVLRDGDLVSVDCGAIIDGWHGDAAVSFTIGEPRAIDVELIRVTEAALWAGIGAARIGGKVGDISAAIEASIVAAGASYGIAEGLTGHGIGTTMHQPPWIPNVASRGRTTRLVPGLVLAVEPMVSIGTSRNRTLDDGWTIVTLDGSRAAHAEHTFTLTERGAWVLTAADGGREQLGSMGLPCGAPAT
ncbi:MAG: type I methionyl aminopeptidase [Aeromicrobium sp.]